MTSNKHRKRAARKAASEKGIALASQVREHREATKAMPAATVPAPIALLMARHLRATGFHLGEVRNLAARERLIPDSTINRRDEPTGPYAVVDTVLEAIQGALTELWVWAERTAHASGAIPVVPDLFDKDPAQDRARDILYPRVEDGWCARGGTMPGPGDEHQVAETNTRTGVRFCLPGAVPTKTLSRHASNTSDAKQVVAGTPAQPVWDAVDDLSRYISGWMDRRGDSPADLAAALEGLREIAGELPDAVSQITREVDDRVKAGRITGVDEARLTTASTEFNSHFHKKADDGFGHVNPVGGSLWDMRHALDGAAAAVTPVQPSDVLTRQFAGQPPAVIREALGSENFVQRQIGKVRPGDYSRADRLTAMLDCIHALGLPEYDSAQHRTALRGIRRGDAPRRLPVSEHYLQLETTATSFIPREVVDEDEEDERRTWATPAINYSGHQAAVVLQDTDSGCWRGWRDVKVDDSASMWNPTVDGEYFVGHRNETRLVMTVGDKAAALLDELPTLVGSVHDGEAAFNCLVCHDHEQAQPPTTLRQLEHQAHRVRAAFERRSGLPMGDGLTVSCNGRGGVMVARLTPTGRVPMSQLMWFEWDQVGGWTAAVKHREVGTSDLPVDVVVAETQIAQWEAWRPARVAEEIERVLNHYR